MKPLTKLVLPVLVAGALVGCNGSDNDTAVGDIRVLHTSPDAPPVNVLLDGTPAIQSLDYAESSGFRSAPTGTYDVAVEAIIPGGNATVLDVPGLDVTANSRTTVLAVGTVAVDEGTDILLEVLAVPDSAADPAVDEVALTIVHASPAAGALGNVDIYLTAPGDALNAAMPVTLGYKGIADAGAVPADVYRVRITPEDDTNTVLFDSGQVDFASFSGQQLVVAAIDEADQSEPVAPVKLLVANDDSGLNIRDTATEAGVRAVHLSPDAANAAVANGPVEVFATIEGGAAVELIDSLAYLENQPTLDLYVGVEPGAYVLDVAPDTGTIDDSIFTSGTVTLEAGMDYSVFAVGYALTTPDFTLVPTMDDNRAIATQASLKVVHGAAAVGPVDVYVTAAGDFTAQDVLDGNAGAPLLSNFAFAEVSDYVAVAEGSYDVRVVSGGVVAINVEGASLSNGDVITAIAYGPDEVDNDPAAAGLLLLSN